MQPNDDISKQRCDEILRVCEWKDELPIQELSALAAMETAIAKAKVSSAIELMD